jgi:ABC-type phosphate/phosphonate transport system substrate-binding protein
MKFKWGFLFIFISLLVMLPFASFRDVSAARQKKPASASGNKNPSPSNKKIVRVGVIYYDDFQQKAEDFRKIISTLTKNSQRGFDFRLLIGTYDEVLDWYQKNLVDVAVMTPGPVAELMRKSGSESARLESLYIGSRGIQPKAGSVVQRESKDKMVPRFEYHSVALVNEQAPQLSVDTLKNSYEKGELEFILVHQLSVSGYILPRYALFENGMPLDASTRNRINLTYSHTNHYAS